MTNTPRQRYGLGSFIKKITKPIKKIAKSKLGKAALIGGGLWGLNKFGMPGMGGAGKGWWGKGLAAARNTGLGSALFGTGALPPSMGMAKSGMLGNIGKWAMNNKGKAALLGLGAAGMAAPFFGGDEDDEEEIQDWTLPSAAIGGLWDRTKDYYKNPGNLASSNLAFMPDKEFVNPRMYSAKGGIAQLANGGNPAEAQAEQMLKMEYQKYRNQGGTMSYQQFKMAVLQQAQGQGPMAQGQGGRPSGDRPMFQGGELVEDASMVEETPEGMMAENVEEVQGEPSREQLEALAMEIFQLRLEELDEEQLMVVYQAAMEQQPREEEMQEEIAFNPQMSAPQMAANGGRIGFWPGGPAGGASAGGNYGGNVNPQQEYAGKTFAQTYGGGNNQGGSSANVLSMVKPIVKPTNVADTSSNTLMARNVGPALIQMRNFERKSKAPDIYGELSAEEERMYKKSLERDKEDTIYNTPVLTAAHGGRVGRAEGGIMDLGGMEKDYRAEGGFVPLGGEERADDVPARLSKNEFVFTADAVRAAGGGDIDQGAEVMQNMMQNLEQGGEISEESQGAQGMYNNMKQLETRVE